MFHFAVLPIWMETVTRGVNMKPRKRESHAAAVSSLN